MGYECDGCVVLGGEGVGVAGAGCKNAAKTFQLIENLNAREGQNYSN